MSLPRTDPRYLAGLNNFLDFAFRYSGVNGMIMCPCRNCNFNKWLTREDVFNHCLLKPFPPSYHFWGYHGEHEYRQQAHFEVGSSSQVGRQIEENDDDDDVGEDDVREDPMVEALRDAFDVRDEEEEDVDGPPPEFLRDEAAKNFFDLMPEAETPLYEGNSSIYFAIVINNKIAIHVPQI